MREGRTDGRCRAGVLACPECWILIQHEEGPDVEVVHATRRASARTEADEVVSHRRKRREDAAARLVQEQLDGDARSTRDAGGVEAALHRVRRTWWGARLDEWGSGEGEGRQLTGAKKPARGGLQERWR